MHRFYNHAPKERNSQTRDDNDHWQPVVGLFARKIARDLAIPLVTVVAALEANGINVVAD